MILNLRATKIQTAFRKHLAVCKYFAVRTAAIKVQLHCRRWMETRRFQKVVDAALTIQSAVRGLRARRSLNQIHRQGSDAATTPLQGTVADAWDASSGRIQSSCRGIVHDMADLDSSVTREEFERETDGVSVTSMEEWRL